MCLSHGSYLGFATSIHFTTIDDSKGGKTRRIPPGRIELVLLCSETGSIHGSGYIEDGNAG